MARDIAGQNLPIIEKIKSRQDRGSVFDSEADPKLVEGVMQKTAGGMQLDEAITATLKDLSSAIRDQSGHTKKNTSALKKG